MAAPHEDDVAAFAQLASALRDAHLALEASGLPDAEKSSARRRLLAISDAAKKDAGRAAKRLDAWWEDLRGL